MQLLILLNKLLKKKMSFIITNSFFFHLKFQITEIYQEIKKKF